jgi:hypothetical protein
MNWVLDQDGNDHRHGTMMLQRLSRVMGMDCGRPMSLPVIMESQLSGSWYDPTHSGEGYVLEVLLDKSILVYWFSFDPLGNRRWFFGVGEIADGKLVFSELSTTRGPVFGAGYDAQQLIVEPWGSLELELVCDSGTARFTPTESGFPAGTLNLDRLTLLDGLSCD